MPFFLKSEVILINKKKFRNIKSYINAYLFIIPSFLFLGVFTYWPIIKSFLFSLTKYDISTPQATFIGFSNYIKMFISPL